MIATGAALLLVLAACGSDSGSGDSSAPDGPSSTIASTTSEATAVETTMAETSTAATATTEATTTTAAETTTTGTGIMAGGVFVTEVVFGEHVTLMNTGDAPITLDGMWLCNRPAYLPLSGELGPGETVELLASALGGLAADGGEVGVYTAQDFSNPDAMVDYVAWNGGGGRAQTAAEAGVWTAADATVEATGDQITLTGPSGTPDGWSG